MKHTITAREALGLNIDGNFYVNEFLLADVYSLLHQTKASQAHYKSVWMWRGRICMRKDNGQPIIHINTVEKLSRLIRLPCVEHVAIVTSNVVGELRSAVRDPTFSSPSLKVAQFNPNSFLKRIDIVRAFFESHFYHIISICETCLHSRIKHELIPLNKFFIIRNDSKEEELHLTFMSHLESSG